MSPLRIFVVNPPRRKGSRAFSCPCRQAVRRKPECSLKPAHRVLRVRTENAVNSVRRIIISAARKRKLQKLNIRASTAVFQIIHSLFVLSSCVFRNAAKQLTECPAHIRCRCLIVCTKGRSMNTKQLTAIYCCS